MTATQIAQLYHDCQCASNKLHAHYTKDPSRVARVAADSDGLCVELENGETFDVAAEAVVEAVPEAAALFEERREKSLVERLSTAARELGALEADPSDCTSYVDAQSAHQVAHAEAMASVEAALELVAGSVNDALSKVGDADASACGHLREALAALAELGASTERANRGYSPAAAELRHKLWRRS